MKTFKTHYSRDKAQIIALRLSKTQLTQLQQLAEKKNVSMSEYVRKLIETDYSKDFTINTN